MKLGINGYINSNGANYEAGRCRAISMSADGSKGIGTSPNVIWISAGGAATARESSAPANEVILTRDGSKMFALSTGVVGEQVSVRVDDGLTRNGGGPPCWHYV